MTAAGRQMTQGNGVEPMMAAADKRWQQKRAEARTAAAEMKRWHRRMREDGWMREEADKRWMRGGQKVRMAVDKRL